MKKRFVSIFLMLTMILSLFAGCGSDAAVSVDMLYYLDNGDSTILAACNTAEGITEYGSDFYYVSLNDAKIYNTQGKECQLSELVRGCPIRVEWDGAISESYPAQISAVKITALSDTPHDAVPPEEELTPLAEGGYWRVPTSPEDVPSLNLSLVDDPDRMNLTNLAFSLTTYDNADYAYQAPPVLEGDPRGWFYDSATLDRAEYDTVTLNFEFKPTELYVNAYSMQDAEAPVQPVYMNDNWEISLLDEEYAYVITAVWSSDTCAATAVYAFKA